MKSEWGRQAGAVVTQPEQAATSVQVRSRPETQGPRRAQGGVRQRTRGVRVAEAGVGNHSALSQHQAALGGSFGIVDGCAGLGDAVQGAAPGHGREHDPVAQLLATRKRVRGEEWGCCIAARASLAAREGVSECATRSQESTCDLASHEGVRGTARGGSGAWWRREQTAAAQRS